MKFLSDNLLTLVLAFVLGISPIQSISASVSKCMNMDSDMHAQMLVKDSTEKMSMGDSGDGSNCCNQNDCGTTHCASATIVAVISNNTSDIAYTLSSVYQKPNVTLIPFYSSSLYRPPKI